MNIFSRLFSFLSNKKCNLKDGENSIQPSSSGDSTSTEKYHESGVFCRESRVDQIVSPDPSVLTASAENSEVDSVTFTRTLDTWNPETCVRLLRMPSVQNYSGLCKLISESDKNWMIEFLDMGGLQVLFESVDRLSSTNSYSSRLERTLLLLQCVKCLKTVVNSQAALEHIIQQRTYGTKIAEVLCSSNPLVKKQLFDFMSTLCIFSEDGHFLTLDVLESYRVAQKLRYRFAILLIEIKQAEVMPYVGAVLGLINCIILGASRFRFRTRLRNEFLALGLEDLLESLKQIPDEEVELQCSVFLKSQLADEEYARSIGIHSSFSHFALFQALLDKIEDTPLSASFLVLLQNLNQLDPTDKKTDYVWSILEEITERAISGAGSIFRKWMLSERSLTSTATQTCLSFFSIEDSETYRKSLCDEEYEKDSVKSYSSRDSGVPVSRNQSFASNGPGVRERTLPKHKTMDTQQLCSVEPSLCTESLKQVSEVVYSKTANEINSSNEKEKESNSFFQALTLSNKSDTLPQIKSSSHTETSKFSSHASDSTAAKENIPSNDKEKRYSGSIFKTLTFTNNSTRRLRAESMKENCHNMPPEGSPLSLRSESPIPQINTLGEEGTPKKSFSFSFFNRSKKYSLTKCSPTMKVNTSSPDTQSLSESLSLRSGMTSIDVKRSRKQAQLLNNSLYDSCSVTSSDKNSLEFYENDLSNSSFSRTFTKGGKCKQPECNEQLEHLSKSTSDITQAILPPPPPPPPPPSGLPQIAFRPKSQAFLELPANKNLRSSWSGNPALKEFERTDNKHNTLPMPKSKMKTLNWAKIPSSHVSVHSIWNEINRETDSVELNFEEMEKLFCQTEPRKNEPKIKQRKQTTSEILLLDNKRSLSIAVFLKQFKGGHEEVIAHLRQFKHKEIGAERLRTLFHLLPDSNEVKILSSYTGDVNKLGTAEKFLVQLCALNHYDCLVEGMLLLEEFPTTIQILHDSVQSLLDACQELLTNTGFKNFLKLILVTGNFMNTGSYAGNAIGFRLSTLPKLLETRANKPQITLLHYLVEEIQKKYPDGIQFTNQLLEKLNRCSRLTTENLSAEIMQLDKSMQKLNSQIKAENGQLKKYFSGFIENGIKHLNILKGKMEEINNISVQLANRFCEDEKKFKLEECLHVVSVFCGKIKVANDENQIRKKAEEKKK